MRKITVEQTDTATWAADGTIRTAIEREGLLTHVDFVADVTPSASLDGTNQPDGIFRLVQNIRLMGGSQTYINLPADDGAQGGTLLHYLGMMDGYGAGHSDGGITAPQIVSVPVVFPLHFGSRPLGMYGRDNPYDLTAFIPAGNESQLNAEWVTSGNDVLDDITTITSAVGRFTLHRVVGTEAEIKGEMARQRVNLPQEPGITGMYPSWSAVVHANAAATTDFDAETEPVVVGAFLKRIAFLCQDDTATRTLRAQDELTRVALKVRGTNEDLFRSRLYYQYRSLPYASVTNADDAVQTFGNNVPFGVHAIDLRARAQSLPGMDYGLDLRAAVDGSFRIGMLITVRAAGDDTLFLFERYMPYYNRLVGEQR